MTARNDPRPMAPETGHTDPAKAALMRRATYASVSVALILVAAKLWAWLATGSVAMLTTLTDSALDLIASMVNLVAVRHALTPADEEHRFGHGKAEAIAGLGQAALIFGSSLFLLVEGGQRLLDPQVVVRTELGLTIIGGAIALTLCLVLYQRYVVRQTSSLAISADSVHYKSDLFMNLGVVVSLVLVGQFDLPLADPLIAIAIAFYIGWSAWEIARQSTQQLMDRELSDGERQKIWDIATSHPDVHEIHDLRTRTSGTWNFIQFHVEMDPLITLAEAHRISDEVEDLIRKAFPDSEVFIHQDPAGHEDIPPLERV